MSKSTKVYSSKTVKKLFVIQDTYTCVLDVSLRTTSGRTYNKYYRVLSTTQAYQKVQELRAVFAEP